MQDQLDLLLRARADRGCIALELRGGFTRPPKPFDERNQRLDGLIATAAATWACLQFKPTGGCCDGNNLAAAGLPNIDNLGVVGGEIHSDREFMRVSSLAERAKLSALLLLRLAIGRDRTLELSAMNARSGPSGSPTWTRCWSWRKTAGAGFTSLPPVRDSCEADRAVGGILRRARSTQAGHERYMFVLEDRPAARSAAAARWKRPAAWTSPSTATASDSRCTPAANFKVYNRTPTLYLTNDYTGAWCCARCT